MFEGEDPLTKLGFGWFQMSGINRRLDKSEGYDVPRPREFEQVAKDLCDRALNDAKNQLHPLLQNFELNRLDRRCEFVQAFKCVLEQKIARKLAAWYPGIQAIFRYDVAPMNNMGYWDGSIHLLVKIPCLSKEVIALGKKLDSSLVKRLRLLHWQRFQECQSILEVQQVTPNEIRHRVSYGAMFYAVYNVPSKVWPQNRRGR